MDIYEALRKDHDKVKGLLNRLVSLTQDNIDERHSIIEQIRGDLIPHARAEEAVLYNALRSLDAGKKIVMHGYREHIEAESLLRILQVLDKVDMEWKTTANKLKEALEHHIREEETEIFSVAHQVFSEEEAHMLGEAFEAMKPEIKEEGMMKSTLELMKNLMPPRFHSINDVSNRH
jgi:hemerythrin-like domain-containing protein